MQKMCTNNNQTPWKLGIFTIIIFYVLDKSFKKMDSSKWELNMNNEAKEFKQI
jgi:hypothetical protein